MSVTIPQPRKQWHLPESFTAWRLGLLIFAVTSSSFFVWGVGQLFSSVSSAEQGFALFTRGDRANAQRMFDKAKSTLANVALLYAISSSFAGRHALDLFARAIALDPSCPELYLMRADLYQSQGNLESAAADLTTAIKLFPSIDDEQPDHDRSHAYLMRSKLNLTRQQPAAALEDASVAICLDPDYISAYATRAEAYQRAGDTTRAQADLQRVREMEEEHYSYESVLCELEKNVAGSMPAEDKIAAWTRYLDKFPDSHLAYMQRACVFTEEHRYALSARDLTRAIALQPDCASLYIRRAEAYDSLLERERSKDDYDRAIALSGTATNLLKRAEFFAGIHNFPAAITDCTRALALNSRTAAAYEQRAYAHECQNQLSQAAADLNASLQVYRELQQPLLDCNELCASPDSFTYERLADVYSRMGQPDRAQQCYLEEQSRCETGYIAQANFFKRHQHYEQALSAYHAAIQHGDILSGCEGKGDVFALIGKESDAIAAYSLALRLSSQQQTVDRRSSARLYLKRSQLEARLGQNSSCHQDRTAAIDAVTMAVEERSGPSTYHDRALIYAALGLPEKALADLRKACALDSLNQHYQYHVAQTLLALKQPLAAYELLQKAIARDPTLPELFEGLGDVQMAQLQYNRALMSYTLAWKCGYHDACALMKRSQAYARMGDRKHAEDDQKQAIAAGYDASEMEN